MIFYGPGERFGDKAEGAPLPGKIKPSGREKCFIVDARRRGSPHWAPMARASRSHRWIAALPTLLMFVGVPFANRVEPYVFGLPFLLAWIVGCVVITGPIMGLVRVLDRRAEGAAGVADGSDFHP